MGLYIETPSHRGKADYLIAEHGAREVPIPLVAADQGQVYICVVNNGLFEAAAIAFDSREVGDFSLPSDSRPRRWLVMDQGEAGRLCPGYKAYLARQEGREVR